MRIGIDFDNTIVNYDALFYRVALEKLMIPDDLMQSKLAVRNYLRGLKKEDDWTEMQGYVYGARMDDAVAYPNIIEFMHLALEVGVCLSIVSHKTRYPFLGPRYDLHAAARAWVENNLSVGDKVLIEADQVFFELTQEDKVGRIAELGCDYFIDDLPEIFLSSAFPSKTVSILFDPEDSHVADEVDMKAASWQEITSYFEEKWKTCM